MPRIVLTEEEYCELTRFASDRNLNQKAAVLAFVRAGNRVSSSNLTKTPDSGEKLNKAVTGTSLSETNKI